MSGVFLAGHFLLWTASLKYTSVAASVLLVSLHPIIVTPLGKRLLGERVSRQMLAGVGLAVIGTFVTCAGDFRVDSSAFGGDLLAIAGGLCLAGYLLIGRSVRANLGVAGYSAIVYAVVCVIAALTAVAGGVAHLPSPRVALACFGLARRLHDRWAHRVQLGTPSCARTPRLGLVPRRAAARRGARPAHPRVGAVARHGARRRADPRRARAGARRARQRTRDSQATSRSRNDRRHRVRPSEHRRRHAVRREGSRDGRHVHHRSLPPVRSRADRPGAVRRRSSMATTRRDTTAPPSDIAAGMDRVLSLVHASRIRTIERLLGGAGSVARHRLRARRAHQPDAVARVAGAGNRAVASAAQQARDVFHLDVSAVDVDDAGGGGCHVRRGGPLARRRASPRPGGDRARDRATAPTRRGPAHRRAEFRVARSADRSGRVVPPRRAETPRPLHPGDADGDARRPPGSAR